MAANLFGLAIFLSFGAQQINASLAYLFNVSYSTYIQIIIITIIIAH